MTPETLGWIPVGKAAPIWGKRVRLYNEETGETAIGLYHRMEEDVWFTHWKHMEVKNV